MQEGGYSPRATVVLTTHERAELYRAAFGQDIDLHFRPYAARELHDFLRNCANSGARLVVLDEAHFVSERDLAQGVLDYVDDANIVAAQPELLVVCPEREADDGLLAFLVERCGVYGIVHGCDGAQLVAQLQAHRQQPASRRDVLDILTAPHAVEHAYVPEEEAPAVIAAHPTCSVASCTCDDNACEIKITIKMEIAR